MSLRRLLLIGTVSLTLAACGSTVITAPATVDMEDPAKVTELLQASERVLGRRLAAVEAEDAVVSVAPLGGSEGMVRIKLGDAASKDDVMRILADPFTFDLRLATGTRTDQDGVEETVWSSVGIDGSMLTWVRPIRDKDDGTLGVELLFTDAGLLALKDVFAKNTQKDLGIFVRDLLVSRLTIVSPDIGESIVISGIPSERIAEIFADDVNVGLHVHFSPPSR